MSEELLKKFYTKIYRLLKSKSETSGIPLNNIEEFQKYAEKGEL